MRFLKPSDYLSLAFELGAAADYFASIHQEGLDFAIPDECVLFLEYQERENLFTEMMQIMNLPNTRILFMRVIRQIGGLHKEKYAILESMVNEAEINIATSKDDHSSLPLDQWHDPVRLKSDIMSLMPSGIYAGLPLIAQQDLVDAGECLANRQPTAAAPLLLRCVEATLREFHRCVTGETSQEKDWNTLENEIGLSIGTARWFIIGPIKDIRINHRNPTMHAEKRYNLEEAQRLFYQCIEILTRMTEILTLRNRPKGIA